MKIYLKLWFENENKDEFPAFTYFDDGNISHCDCECEKEIFINSLNRAEKIVQLLKSKVELGE
ncbi:hypothetical protein [Xenorhabdus cabanillasii]|uniref:hypothetical protein n=1 Tax=Xenorhabdus cabanillasii TaxID=351673 RepID=UPI002B40F86E|nr:hypothetical protein [Xenorhabdus sp. Flor]